MKKLVIGIGVAMIGLGTALNKWSLTALLRRPEPFPIATQIEIWSAQILVVLIGAFVLFHGRRDQRTFFRYAKILTINFVITVILLEVTLRLFFHEALYIRTQTTEFYRYDAELGWSFRPFLEAEFSNGRFHGIFHIDANGNRLNSPEGTYREGYRDIFVIGDSQTASLEVDDDETIPSLLEKQLRRRGNKVNVLNLGVRGYGTDQSVRKALQMAKTYSPTDIIYMHNVNDVIENNTIRGKYFGKGVYYRPNESDSFVTHRYPVPEYPNNFFGVVLLDRACQPKILEQETRVYAVPPPTKPWYYKMFYTLRARKQLKDSLNRWLEERASSAESPQVSRRSNQSPDNSANTELIKIQRLIAEDPFYRYDYGLSDTSHSAFWHVKRRAYSAQGITRQRCGSYFEDQLRFLMSLLRTVPSVERIHVVILGVPADGEERFSKNPDSETFRHMQRDGLIDTLIDLPSKTLPLGMTQDDIRCPADPHFCETGTRWVMEQLIEEIDFALE